jgi:hypothetical protein
MFGLIASTRMSSDLTQEVLFGAPSQGNSSAPRAGTPGVSPRVIVNLSDECVALSKCDQPLSGLVRPHGLEAHLPGQNSACATSNFLDKGV